jgi:Domain of unknown function (DUF4410)
MKTSLVVVIALALAPIAMSTQQRPVIVVEVFTTAPDVAWPYDLKTIQAQTIAEFKVMLGKEFDIVAEGPASPQGTVYTLKTRIVAWRAGNLAKRMMIGLGSGRESADIEYQVTDGSGKKVLQRKDTIRTNFYSQGGDSSGTLAHPLAQKISQRIKDAKLK